MARERPQVDYEGIAIDTNVFERYGFQFEKGLLKQLEQFASSPVFLLMSNVVHFEVLKHLEAKVEQTRLSVHKAMTDASNDLGLLPSVVKKAADLLTTESASVVASTRLDKFYEATDVARVDAEGVMASTVMELYFDAQPPFEATGKKKAEFPDAVALLSLENWAKVAKGKIIAVSHDKGWEDFCAKSEWMEYKADLPAALALFQPHTVANNIVDEISELIESKAKDIFLDEITDGITGSVENMDVNIDYTSNYYVGDEVASAAYLNHKFKYFYGKYPDINIVRVTANNLVIQLSVEIDLEVTVSFDLSILDPIDKDLIELNKQKSSQEVKYQTDLLVTLSGDFSKGLGGMTVDNVELTEPMESIDFGDIELQWYEERERGQF